MKSNLLKSVLLLVSGSAAAHVINLLASPILTRLYAPDDFGQMGLFISFVTLLVPLCTMSFQFAVPLEKERYKAISIVFVCVYSALVFVCVFYLVSLVILRLVEHVGLGSLFYLIPLSVVFLSFHSVIEQWYSRERSFFNISTLSLLQSVLVNFTKVVLGLLGVSSGLVLGQSLLGFLGFVVLSLFVLKHITKDSFSRAKSAFASHVDFLLYRTPQTLLSAVSQSLPVFFFGGVYGSSVAGYYVLAKSIVSAAAFLVGGAITNALSPRFLELSASGRDFHIFYKKLVLVLFFFIFVCYLIFTILSKDFFMFVYGDAWLVAGDFSVWLALWFSSSLLARPAIIVFAICGVQVLLLRLEIIMLIFNLLFFYVCFHFKLPELTTLIYYCFINSIHYCLMVFMAGLVLKRSSVKY